MITVEAFAQMNLFHYSQNCKRESVFYCNASVWWQSYQLNNCRALIATDDRVLSIRRKFIELKFLLLIGSNPNAAPDSSAVP